MGSRAIEAEIDRLYQVPLEEFTPARNTLAKKAGSEAARVRGLSKPPIAAWAVNQLYWKHGDVWNALVAAAENAQRAHRALLAGKAADVRAASKVHEDAVDKALRATLALLVEAKHPATDTTKHAIGTTLRAVPGDEPPGRFTRTLQPAGFGMLTGIAIAPGAPAKRQKPAPAPGPTRTSTRAEPKVDAKALTRARQAAAAAAETLRTAEAAVRREEFERARTEREETRAATAVEKAREASERAAAELAEAVAAAKEATRLRESAAKRASAAEAALPRARKEAAAAAADLQALEKGR